MQDLKQDIRAMKLETTECRTIKIDDALKEKDALFVDVRTPKEYIEAHILHAINIPLMSNYQRHIIGTIYNQQTQENAIKKGWDFFEPVVKDFIEQFKKIKSKKIIIYCWRGGMRSRIVVNLLKLFGIKAFQLEEGFKLYMNEIIWEGIKRFEKSYKPKFIVLFGNTGTRKTAIINNLIEKGVPAIDFEGLAQHRASVYGGVNLNPRSQKMFSILLYHELDRLKDKKYIIVEGESNKIGNVFLPKFISRKIESDIKINLKADIKTRVAAIREEYFSNKKSIEDLHKITGSLAGRIGKKDVQMLRGWLDSKEYDKFTEYLLINYYDKRYIHNKKGYDYDIEVNSDDLNDAVNGVVDFYKSIK